MLTNITTFLTARRLRLPILGLLLTLGVVGEQTRPVLSNQLQTASNSITLDGDFAESGDQTPVLTRLRQVQEQRNLIRGIAVEEQSENNIQQSEVETSNTDSNEVTRRSKLVSSSQLLRNIRNTPEVPALVTRIPGSTRARANFPQKDGTYLYGDSPQANQIGQSYILFENRQGRITGALYMPQSNFSCFQGAINPSGELAMTVTTSPGDVGINQLATANQFQLPSYSDDQMITYPYSVGLQDYHPINSISTNDERILQSCKAIYQ